MTSPWPTKGRSTLTEFPDWLRLFWKRIVKGLDEPDLAQSVESEWRVFLKDDLPRIEQAFQAHQWPAAGN
jgi:hypothetical protein